MEAAELSKVLDAGGNSGLGRPFSAARMRTIERRLRKLEQVTQADCLRMARSAERSRIAG
jgi:hypothetical protein